MIKHLKIYLKQNITIAKIEMTIIGVLLTQSNLVDIHLFYKI